jgi:GntR family transcriptional regulator, transcriptional repressor for pyruvate dehydrogenase complex
MSSTWIGAGAVAYRADMATIDLFAPVRARRAVEEAVEQIADRIRSGELGVGDGLPSERTLSARMEISRKTLREAIKLLSEAGVIEVRPGATGGMFVLSEFIPAELRQNSQMRFAEISYVLETRRLFEPQVAQLAGVFAESEDFAVMDRTIALQRKYAGDRTRVLSLDMRFHLALARSTRNPVMVDVMRSLLAKIEIAFDMTMRAQPDLEEAIAIHVETLEALRGRDPDRISVVMDRHMRYLEDRFQADGGRLRLRQLPDFLVPGDGAA